MKTVDMGAVDGSKSEPDFRRATSTLISDLSRNLRSARITGKDGGSPPTAVVDPM